MNFASVVGFAARNAAESVAVTDSAESATFGELRADTNRVASGLAARGVEPDDHVAIHLPSGVSFLRGYLGALSCGAVAVPVNTRFSDEQVEYVLSDSGAVAVITDGGDGVGTDPGLTGVERFDIEALLRAGSPEHDTTPRRADELAALMYTSGTTGAPKGVYHTHGNLDSNASGFIKYNGWSRDDVALTVCQCFHVTGLNITTTPFLALEATNHIREWDPETVLSAIERHRVTYTFLIPSMVLELLGTERRAEYDTSSLKAIGVGGAPMPKRRIPAVEDAFGCPLLEGYGMTETTPLAALNRSKPGDRRIGSVGRVISEAVELRVEDPRTGATVDPGERGELLWRGETVTPGYRNRTLTETAFVERDGDRWLRSGDIGFVDEDGFLYVVDRRADMFTTGCGEIYPREIEEVIYGIAGVERVAIIDTKDDVHGAVVTAVITGAAVDAETVRAVCERELQRHEVPNRIAFVDDIPRTATGKVDRSGLRARLD